LLLPRAQRRDLIASIGNTLLPKLLFGSDGFHALLAKPHFTLEAFERGFGARLLRAHSSSPCLCRGERRLKLREGGKARELRFDTRTVLTRLVLRCARARDGFGERSELLRIGLRRLLGGCDRIACAIELCMGLLGRLAKRLGLLRRGLQFAHGIGKICFGRLGALLCLRPLGLEGFEAAPLDEARCCGAGSSS